MEEWHEERIVGSVVSTSINAALCILYDLPPQMSLTTPLPRGRGRTIHSSSFEVYHCEEAAATAVTMKIRIYSFFSTSVFSAVAVLNLNLNSSAERRGVCREDRGRMEGCATQPRRCKA